MFLIKFLSALIRQCDLYDHNANMRVKHPDSPM